MQVVFVGQLYYGDRYPAHPLPEPPPGIWPSPGHPAHPIAPGGPPPGIWPAPGYPAHPIAPGGPPPGIWPGPGRPSHPIVVPPVPPSIWPGPGRPEHPIVLPPDAFPMPPIYIDNPPSIWPSPGHPAHPIAGPEHPAQLPAGGFVLVWSPVPSPQGTWYYATSGGDTGSGSGEPPHVEPH